MLDFNLDISALPLPKNFHLSIKENEKEPDLVKFNATQKRLAEFQLSRECLRDCCQKLGYKFDYDLTGQKKTIILDPDLIFSISHSKLVAIAIVGPKNLYERCGVDIEFKNRDLSAKFIRRVTTPEERDLIARYKNQQLVATLIFSAKETVYKAFSELIDSFSYQNIVIKEKQNGLSAQIINQKIELPIFNLSYAFYKQTHLVTCLIIPRY